MSLTELNDFLSAEQIQTDKDILDNYGRDWTRFWQANPSVVLFPRTTEEVQKIILWANKHALKVVPSGGRTGLSGGAVAKDKEVVLSLDKLNQIENFNEIDKTLDCGAGVITEALQDFVKEKSYYFPVDFAARGSSQIGGNIATNAGGIKVIRYGNMREWVAGLEVVTGKGEVLNLNNGLIKNNTGYDFRHLFIGSEGTLGIITKAKVKFTTLPKEEQVLLLAVPSLKEIMPIFKVFTKELPVTAFEMFTDKALKYVLKSTELASPFPDDYSTYLVVEVENQNESIEEKIMECFEKCMEEGWIMDGLVSQSPTQAKEFWTYREQISEALAFAPPHKNDISVNVSKIPDFIEKVDQIYQEKYPQFEVIWFGHIGDGNVHVNILRPQDMEMDDFLNEVHKVDDILFQEIKVLGGSVSAEHGVGLVKKKPLSYTRSLEEIEIMKSMKKVFDPNLVLNPGKVFDI
ncbi:MAG: FAD-binding oxidoreductase [Bdellovibrionota bacterium]|nr:FAD-binding oxidoreductase [Bdellovibrionota bacterium]